MVWVRGGGATLSRLTSRTSPCQMIAPKMEKIAEEFSAVKIYKIDIDTNQETPAKLYVCLLVASLVTNSCALQFHQLCADLSTVREWNQEARCGWSIRGQDPGPPKECLEASTIIIILLHTPRPSRDNRHHKSSNQSSHSQADG